MQLSARSLPPGSRRWTGPLTLALLTVALLGAGCSTRRVAPPAPVEDRSAARPTDRASERPAAVDPRTLPGAENAGKPGYYTVRPGDTLFRIGLEHGQSWRDIAQWSQLSNPNQIEVGQVLRVVPPVAAAPAPTPTGPAVTAPVVTAPVEARPLGTPVPAPAPAPVPSAVPARPTPAPSTPATSEELQFIWPAQGQVIAGFDEASNKGIGIAGRLGDPVLAAADGRVVYAGAGLRGYGNLVILKHNNTYLTAYAHNQALLVREDQSVKQGQRIAEMGSSDTDRVKLHFEVRRQGKPVDPLGFLPKR